MLYSFKEVFIESLLQKDDIPDIGGGCTVIVFRSLLYDPIYDLSPLFKIPIGRGMEALLRGIGGQAGNRGSSRTYIAKRLTER